MIYSFLFIIFAQCFYLMECIFLVKFVCNIRVVVIDRYNKVVLLRKICLFYVVSKLVFVTNILYIFSCSIFLFPILNLFTGICF
jgi:hypothetical protein